MSIGAGAAAAAGVAAASVAAGGGGGGWWSTDQGGIHRTGLLMEGYGVGRGGVCVVGRLFEGQKKTKNMRRSTVKNTESRYMRDPFSSGQYVGRPVKYTGRPVFFEWAKCTGRPLFLSGPARAEPGSSGPRCQCDGPALAEPNILEV